MKKYFFAFAFFVVTLFFAQIVYAESSFLVGCPDLVACNIFNNQSSCQGSNPSEEGTPYCRWVEGDFNNVGYCENIPCGVSNCCYCRSEGECAQCSNGFDLTEDGECEPSELPIICEVEHCIHCSDNDSQKCLECQFNYVLNPSGSACCSIQENCTSYGESCACTGCQFNYVLNTNGSACCSIQEHCSSYGESCACTGCEEGYHLEGGACTRIHRANVTALTNVVVACED